MTRFPRTWSGWIVAVLCIAGCAIACAGLVLAGERLAMERVAQEHPSPHTMRQELLERMKADPNQPWPRGGSHVVLAWPGTDLAEKGYLEPGGSFSPGVGSFGILLQVGSCNSAKVSLDKIHQQMDEGLGVRTVTPCYTADWSVESPSSFLLQIEPAAGQAAAILLRSDGPAGGPLDSVVRSGNGLLIDNTWIIAPADAARALPEPSVTGTGDWLQATVSLGAVRKLRVQRILPSVADASLQATGKMQPLPAIDVPDARFVASAHAQILHLLMGTVRDETRPGDPVNYSQPWIRDGAYAVVALARAGQLEKARALALYFARHAYFGGFGPEADAPGNALWAIGETAERLHDQDFDREVWPSVVARAEQIVRMRRTATAMRAVSLDPLIQRAAENSDSNLLCEPARDGLIVGRMDWMRPLLYVNGTAYEGLRAAARIAGRRPDGQAYAARWNAEAEQVRVAWWHAFDQAEKFDHRGAIIGLWPSNVASDQPLRYDTLLDRLWKHEHSFTGGYSKRPLWTYFNVAQAHEWLLSSEAGAPDGLDRTWKVLNWFFSNQTSEGLYTWWEGSGEENTSGLWERVRGWTSPQFVSPHYWTAAEMLSLQLDMLVHEDENGQLTIGLGVPREWIAHPMRVDGIYCSRGRVSWQWDGRRMAVQLNGKEVAYRLGPSFR